MTTGSNEWTLEGGLPKEGKTYTYFCRIHPFMRGSIRTKEREERQRLTMRRALFVVAMLGIVAALSVGTTASGKAKTATVDVDDDFYSPTKLTVKEDKKVEWNWIAEDVHDVTKGSGPGKFFESGPQQGTGVLYSKTFKKPGKYEIICSLHDEMRMKIKVEEKKKNN